MLRRPELFVAIPDGEVPHLEPYKLRSAVALAAILSVISVLEIVVEVLLDRVFIQRSLVMMALTLVVCGSVVLGARRRPRHADAMLMATALMLLLDLAVASWINRDHRNDLLVYVPVVPLILAGFAPWRPSYSLALGAGTMGVLVANAALGVYTGQSMAVVLFVAASCAVAGAFATQLQRRVWHKLAIANAQLAASDRMSVLGRMSAGIAHEMKTPLAAAMNGLESTRTLAAELAASIDHPGVESDDLREITRELSNAVEGAASATRRAARFISAIREHTIQTGVTELAPFSVASAVNSTVTLVEHARRRSGVVIDTSGIGADLVVVGDEGKLGQIVTNLVCNAVDACRDGRGTKVVVTARAVNAGEEILLAVEDDGPGVPEALRERIFEALFTTKREAEGTGLGLAIARDVARGALGGTLTLVSTVERGARFELRFPRQSERVSQAAPWQPARVA